MHTCHPWGVLLHVCVHVHVLVDWGFVQRYYRLDISCHACPDAAWILIVIFVLAICALLMIGIWLNQRRINLAALGIGVDFAQVQFEACFRSHCGLLCVSHRGTVVAIGCSPAEDAHC